MSPAVIARPSAASLFIVPSFGGTGLGSGTAFLVQHGGVTYLMTNWHNVSGRNPQTGATMHPSGTVPDSVKIFHNRAQNLGQWVEKVEPLYDASGARKWREHPAFPNGQVDAIALPLTDLNHVETIGYDPWNTGAVQPVFGASDNVNIIGFPFGLTGGGYLAIWIRGAVASEPQIDFNDRPCFLVDARTRPGQSGSPVIIYVGGGAFTSEEGNTVMGMGQVERLLGIYSGRINEESDLGFVWKVEALRTIVEQGI